jgi:hypothetical protein
MACNGSPLGLHWGCTGVPMAATHPRRKRASLALSATCGESSLRNTNDPRVNAEFVLTLDAPSLTARQLIFRILQISGPYTVKELSYIAESKYRRKFSAKTIEHVVRELKELNLVVKANGGYAIFNWMEIGA